MTDTLAIGSMAWSHVRKGAEGHHVGGCVVDTGVTEGGEPYVLVLADANRPIKAWQVKRRVVARRIMLADVDESLTEPPNWTRMVGGARGALLTVGCGSGGFSVDEREMCLYGAQLLELACR